MMRRLPWFEILLTIVVLSATVYAAASDAYNLPNRWFIRDDAYYYFKVAQNISEGHGSTFDGIHTTNGYHPIWLLICVPIFALARFDLILPLRILAVVTGCFQAATAIMLFRLVKRAVSPPMGMLAGAYWAFNSYILVFLYRTGVESIVALFFILLMLLALQRLELRWRSESIRAPELAGLGVLGLLIALSRLDLAFLSLVFGLWIVFRGSPLRYLLPLDLLAFAVASISAFLVRLGFAGYYDVTTSVLVAIGGGAILKLAVLYLAGGYRHPATWERSSVLWRWPAAIAAATLILAALTLVASAAGALEPISLVVIALDGALSLGLALLIRLGAYAFSAREGGGRENTPLAVLRAQWKRWASDGGIYYGILGSGLGLYMLANRLAFGTFSPVSGQIKHWWGTFIHSIYGSAANNWLTFFAVNPYSDFNAWAPPTTILSDWTANLFFRGALGIGSSPRWQQGFGWVLLVSFLLACLVLVVRKRKSARAIALTAMVPMFVGSWLQVIAYNVTGYASPKEWYWLAEPIFLVLAAAALLNVLLDLLKRVWIHAPKLAWAAVAVYAIGIAYGYVRDTYYLSPYGAHPAGTPYTSVIPFLEQKTEPGAVIGMTGGGNIGYLMPSRTIVNMDGLINSYEYFKALQAGSAADYLYSSGMRYVFANPSLLASNPYRGQFDPRLELVTDWGGKDLLRLLPAPSP